MEHLFKVVKYFLIGSVNPICEAHDLPKFSEKNIKFGSIDPFKTPNEKMLCSVYPEEQEDEETSITEIETRSRITLTVVCKNDKYEKLLSWACGYSEAIKDALAQNYIMRTVIEDEEGTEEELFVDNVVIGTRSFYPDAGIAEHQATAVEIELTIYTSDTIGD